MFGHRLPGHVEVRCELAERLPVARAQPIEQETAAGVSECLEDVGHLPGICNLLVACQALSSIPTV
jgi:hypothetical protein